MRYITPEVVMRGRFDEHPRPSWEIAVLCFRDRRGSQALVEALGAIPLGYRVFWGMERSDDRPFVYETSVGASQVGIVSHCVWGGPQAAILVEELAYLGVTHLIGFGAAGSIVPALTKGTQIVASTGIVTDGTSRAYTKQDNLPANSELCSFVCEVGNQIGVNVVPVKVATVDAVYRETNADIQRWLGRGAQVINMETTPFYAASAECGVESVWIGHVSDCLVNDEWDSWEQSDSMTETSVRITVGVLERLSG
jgi:uridine phosphorylase